MPSLLLVGHGGFSDRGCEAIVRTTCSLLRGRFPRTAVQPVSFRPGGGLGIPSGRRPRGPATHPNDA
jgi:hypothetical protein